MQKPPTQAIKQDKKYGTISIFFLPRASAELSLCKSSQHSSIHNVPPVFGLWFRGNTTAPYNHDLRRCYRPNPHEGKPVVVACADQFSR